MGRRFTPGRSGIGLPAISRLSRGNNLGLGHRGQTPQSAQDVPGHPDCAAGDYGDDGAEDDAAQAQVQVFDEDEAEEGIDGAGDEGGGGEGMDFADRQEDRAAYGGAAA